MHLHTIVKVMASSENEAIKFVNNLLTNNGDYMSPFDWVAEDETKISDEVKTEEDFIKLREVEREEYIENLHRAADPSLSENMKGYYTRKAGECLEDDNFWSTESIAFTLDWQDGPDVYYVETDRHY